MIRQIMLLGVLAVAGAGCATTQNQTMTTQLQMRVGELERELSARDGEISQLRDEVKGLSYEVDRMKTQPRSSRSSSSDYSLSSSRATGADGEIIRVGVSVEKVQSALKKAGYYEGNVDGKLGSGTKAGISRFQADHNLKSDGIVGAKTWDELKTYLE